MKPVPFWAHAAVGFYLSVLVVLGADVLVVLASVLGVVAIYDLADR